jgi:hypothetical protein
MERYVLDSHAYHTVKRHPIVKSKFINYCKISCIYKLLLL